MHTLTCMTAQNATLQYICALLVSRETKKTRLIILVSVRWTVANTCDLICCKELIVCLFSERTLVVSYVLQYNASYCLIVMICGFKRNVCKKKYLFLRALSQLVLIKPSQKAVNRNIESRFTDSTYMDEVLNPWENYINVGAQGQSMRNALSSLNDF